MGGASLAFLVLHFQFFLRARIYVHRVSLLWQCYSLSTSNLPFHRDGQMILELLFFMFVVLQNVKTLTTAVKPRSIELSAVYQPCYLEFRHET